MPFDEQLREQWQKLVDTDPVPLCEKPTSRIDALSTLSRCTLDIIGLGGFSYNFDSLARDADKSGSHVEDELHEAFKVVFSERKITMREVLANYIPVLKLFVRLSHNRSVTWCSPLHTAHET